MATQFKIGAFGKRTPLALKFRNGPRSEPPPSPTPTPTPAPTPAPPSWPTEENPTVLFVLQVPNTKHDYASILDDRLEQMNPGSTHSVEEAYVAGAGVTSMFDPYMNVPDPMGVATINTVSPTHVEATGAATSLIQSERFTLNGSTSEFASFMVRIPMESQVSGNEEVVCSSMEIWSEENVKIWDSADEPGNPINGTVISDNVLQAYFNPQAGAWFLIPEMTDTLYHVHIRGYVRPAVG